MRTVITRKALGVSWDESQVQGCIIRAGIAEVAIEKIVRIQRKMDGSIGAKNSLADDLTTLIAQMGSEVETCVASLPEAEIMYRMLTRPFTDRRKIAETIGPEVETLLPSIDSKLLVDFVLLGKDLSGAHMIQALCTPSTAVQNLVGVCRAARLEAEIIDCPSVAIAGGARELLDLPEDKVVVVMHMAWSDISVAVLSGKIIRYVGALPFGFGKILSGASSGSAGFPAPVLEDAILSKVEGGDRLKWYFREILIMLEKGGNLEGDLVLLPTGYARLIKDLAQAADDVLGIPIIDLSLKDIQFSGGIDELSQGFLSASLALRAFDTTDAVNFRQGEVGFTRQMKRFKKYGGPWLAAAVILLLLWITGLSLDVFFKARVNADLTKKIKAEFISVMPRGTPMVDATKQMEQYLGRLSGHAGSLDGGQDATPLEILKDLSASISKDIDVIFDSINIDETSITLTGSTANYNNVEQIQGLFSKLPSVKKVKVVSANVDKTDQKVKMKLLCEK